MNATPYEKQLFEHLQRRCGAAALSMVLRSFGIEADQDRIWNETQNNGRIETIRLAQFAIRFGCDAVVGRLAKPWMFLEKLKPDQRFIINHRIRADSPLGHFSVFVGFSDCGESVIVHDPQLCPNRRIAIDELSALWIPGIAASEITGFVGVLVANNKENPSGIKCDKCGESNSIPVDFDEQLWSRIFCVNCGSATTKAVRDT